MKKHILLSLLIFTLAACSSAQLRVQSEPSDVEVSVSALGSKDLKPIGKTPFEVPFTDLSQKAGITDTGDYFVLTFLGKETEPKQVLVPLHSIGMKTTTVKVKLEPKQDIKGASAILQRIHLAQKFAQSGQLERAHVEADKVIEMDPQFVRALSLKASLYYVQKNFNESIKWYEKALAVDPAFEEAVKMITKIKQEQK